MPQCSNACVCLRIFKIVDVLVDTQALRAVSSQQCGNSYEAGDEHEAVREKRNDQTGNRTQVSAYLATAL